MEEKWKNMETCLAGVQGLILGSVGFHISFYGLRSRVRVSHVSREYTGSLP